MSLLHSFSRVERPNVIDEIRFYIEGTENDNVYGGFIWRLEYIMVYETFRRVQ